VVTDHSKGLPIAGGKDEAAFATQRCEITLENARLAADRAGLTLLAGIEMNLSPTGDGDMEPELLRTLDRGRCPHLTGQRRNTRRST
jgi:histidinol phosphatase-like PHP family hydrolase